MEYIWNLVVNLLTSDDRFFFVQTHNSDFISLFDQKSLLKKSKRNRRMCGVSAVWLWVYLQFRPATENNGNSRISADSICTVHIIVLPFASAQKQYRCINELLMKDVVSQH